MDTSIKLIIKYVRFKTVENTNLSKLCGELITSKYDTFRFVFDNVSKNEFKDLNNKYSKNEYIYNGIKWKLKLEIDKIEENKSLVDYVGCYLDGESE